MPSPSTDTTSGGAASSNEPADGSEGNTPAQSQPQPASRNVESSAQQQQDTSGTEAQDGNVARPASNRPSTKCKPLNDKLPTLATKAEATEKPAQFTSFMDKIKGHVGSTFDNPKDMDPALTDPFKAPLGSLVTDLPTKKKVALKYGIDYDSITDAGEKETIDKLWSEKVKEFSSRETTLRGNCTKLFETVLGQCSPALTAELKGHKEFKEKKSERDLIWLLTKLKLLTSGLSKNTNLYAGMFKLLKAFYTVKQKDEESLEDYHKRFEALASTIKASDGKIANHPCLINHENQGDRVTEVKDASGTVVSSDVEEIVESSFLAVAFLFGANQGRYGSLLNDLSNATLVGRDDYPLEVASAYDLLSRYKGKPTSGNYQKARPRSRGGRGRGRGSNGRNQQQDRNTNQTGTRNVVMAHLPAKSDDNHPPADATNVENKTPIAGKNGVLVSGAYCTNCGSHGHAHWYCPKPTSAKGVQLSQVGDEIPAEINPHWLLLDSASTVSSVKSESMVTKIEPAGDDSTKVFTNGGEMEYSHAGELRFFPFRVFYNKDSIANILSLAHIRDKYKVTMDSSVDDAFYVHISPKHILRFQRHSPGLYYIDTRNLIDNKNEVNAYSFFSTVKANKEYFSSRDIEGADRARVLQQLLQWPSTADFKRYINENLLINCDVTSDDVNRAISIYGEQVPILRGKKVRRELGEFKSTPFVHIPPDILKHHPTDEIDVDFFFVNGNPYFHMKTKRIKFRATQTQSGRGKVETSSSLKEVINIIENRGFKITAINGDNEFNKIKPLMRPTPVHTTGRDEHLPRIERDIRVMEERVRCTTSAMPYKRIPKQLLDGIIEWTIVCLNDFPANNGVSRTLSPAAIILGRGKRDCSHLTIALGAYAEVKEKTTNTNKYRTVPAIAIRPSNDRGGYYFLSLLTGRVLHCQQWTELPTTDQVITKVESMAEDQGQPIMNDKVPLFEWEPGIPILDDVNDYAEDAYEESDDEGDNNYDEEMGEAAQEVETQETVFPEEGDEAEDEEDEEAEPLDNDIHEAEDEENTEPRQISDESDGESEDSIDESGEDETIVEQEELRSEGLKSRSEDMRQESRSEQIEEPEEQTSRRSTRQRSAPAKFSPKLYGKSHDTEPVQQYKHHEVQFLQLSNQRQGCNKQLQPQERRLPLRQLQKLAVDVIFTQLSVKRGLKKHGEKAVGAVVTEFEKFMEYEAIGAADPDKMTFQEKKKALDAHTFLKEKRCGRLRARTVADGRPQRAYVPREEANSPTVGHESLMGTLLVDAKEDRDVAIFDVPSAYLQADMPEEKNMHLKFSGEAVDIMCKVNQEYLKHVRMENGKKVLYTKILKAVYGCIESALLWYKMYVDTLSKMGFKLNKVDRCVANKTIDGQQCTIAWYVDDNKLSHKDPKVVSKILEEIDKVYPGLVISRGKKHTLLGMDIEFIGNGRLTIGTKEYILEAFDTFGENVSQKVTSPANLGLFKIDDNSPLLNPEKSDKFHSVTEKILWVEKRGRPDIETAISFLCTRVLNPTEQDWKKLRRLLCFFNGTIDDVRVLGADELDSLLTFVDAAYAWTHRRRDVYGDWSSPCKIKQTKNQHEKFH